MHVAFRSHTRASLSQRQAFTLIELLVVIGLIAGLAGVFIGGLRGGGKSAALQSGQAMVANLIAAARTRAMATGQSVRVLVHVDPDSTLEPLRYLRYLVVQEQVSAGWQSVMEVYLPDGVYVVPGDFPVITAGLFRTGTEALWITADGGRLRSTALQKDQLLSHAVNSPAAERWVWLAMAAAGTTANAGNLVLAAGKVRAPGSYAAGESPVELNDADAVCGLKLSKYGVSTLINNRVGF